MTITQKVLIGIVFFFALLGMIPNIVWESIGLPIRSWNFYRVIVLVSVSLIGVLVYLGVR